MQVVASDLPLSGELPEIQQLSVSADICQVFKKLKQSLGCRAVPTVTVRQK